MRVPLRRTAPEASEHSHRTTLPPVLGRRRFDDLLRRQLDLFEADEEPLLSEAWILEGSTIHVVGTVGNRDLVLPSGRQWQAAGAARWALDRSVDTVRARFGREAVGYAAVVFSDVSAVPEEFRELAEKLTK